jgi:hypothetical protein
VRLHGSKRWKVGRLSFGISWDLDGLTLPRFYRHRDQPETFGLRFAPYSTDDFFSLDFEWLWREGCACPFPGEEGYVRENCPVHDPDGTYHSGSVQVGARQR